MPTLSNFCGGTYFTYVIEKVKLKKKFYKAWFSSSTKFRDIINRSKIIIITCKNRAITI
jgi:hypothetical protein